MGPRRTNEHPPVRKRGHYFFSLLRLNSGRKVPLMFWLAQFLILFSVLWVSLFAAVWGPFGNWQWKIDFVLGVTFFLVARKRDRGLLLFPILCLFSSWNAGLFWITFLVAQFRLKTHCGAPHILNFFLVHPWDFFPKISHLHSRDQLDFSIWLAKFQTSFSSNSCFTKSSRSTRRKREKETLIQHLEHGKFWQK